MSRLSSPNHKKNDGSVPTTPMTMIGGEGAGTPGPWGAKKLNSNEKQSMTQGSPYVEQREKDGSRVNYSTYDPATYFEQSPYESNDYYLE